MEFATWKMVLVHCHS